MDQKKYSNQKEEYGFLETEKSPKKKPSTNENQGPIKLVPDFFYFLHLTGHSNTAVQQNKNNVFL